PPHHDAHQHVSSAYQPSPYEPPHASAPGQQDSSAVPGQSFPAAPQASPAPQVGGSGAGAQKSGEANFFKAMVDFKFDHFITVKFSTFLYILAFVVENCTVMK